MLTSTVFALKDTFLKLVGEVLADLKALQIADIDIELLRLKRSRLAEELEQFKSNVKTAVVKEKAHVEQDMTSRGLSNTTVRVSAIQAVERDANGELEKASREYNRAIEEIALIERRVKECSRPWWSRWFGK